MKNWIIAAAILVASCTASAPVYAQCQTEQALVVEVEAKGVTLGKLRAFTGEDVEKFGAGVDGTVAEDVDYEDASEAVVYGIVFPSGDKAIGIAFLKDGCVQGVNQLSLEDYQHALTLAFGPRA